MHVSVTQHLNKSDKNCSSLATPKEISRAVLQLVDPGLTGVVPTPRMVTQDIDRLDYSMREVMKVNSKIVPSLAGCSGHYGRRHDEYERKTDPFMTPK